MQPIDVELAETFLCRGNWDSWIGDTDDGVFELETVDPNTGAITGWHVFSEQERYPVAGWCFHPPPYHYIILTETRPNIVYTYFGEVLRKGSGKHRTRGGRRRQGVVVTAPTPATLASLGANLLDEEWMGVKTT